MAADEYARVPREKARERALSFLRSRPALIGEVALAIGPLWSLEETEDLLDSLVLEGSVTREAGPLIRYAGVVDPTCGVNTDHA
jgi:hypothetical protein